MNRSSRVDDATAEGVLQTVDQDTLVRRKALPVDPPPVVLIERECLGGREEPVAAIPEKKRQLRIPRDLDYGMIENPSSAFSKPGICRAARSFSAMLLGSLIWQGT